MKQVVFRGTAGVNRYEAESDVFSENTLVMYGLGGDDLIHGAFLNKNEIFGGAGADELQGGGQANWLYGEDGDDILMIRAGDIRSSLFGGAGDDFLHAGDGGDLLHGGAGADNLIGGDGGDTFVVGSRADQVHETYVRYFDNDPNPADTVRSSVSWTLGSNLENLALTGSADTAGTGNGLRNQITGNSGSNSLSGMGGNDRLSGGLGADLLIGGAGADKMEGGRGRDTIDAGNDTRVDHFVFSSRNDSGVGSARDTLKQFDRGEDKIDLRAIDAKTSTVGVEDAFKFSGNTAAANSVWWAAGAGGVVIKADVTGDRQADVEILVLDVVGIGPSDFLL